MSRSTPDTSAPTVTRLPSLAASTVQATNDDTHPPSLSPMTVTVAPHLPRISNLDTDTATASITTAPQHETLRPGRNAKGNRMRQRSGRVQRHFLETIYAKVKSPDEHSRALIAQALGWPEKSVRVWYQNHRQNDSARLKSGIPADSGDPSGRAQPLAGDVDATEVIMQATQQFQALLAKEARSHETVLQVNSSHGPIHGSPQLPTATVAVPQSSRPRTVSVPITTPTDLDMERQGTGTSKRRRINTSGDAVASKRAPMTEVSCPCAGALIDAEMAHVPHSVNLAGQLHLPCRVASLNQVGCESTLSIPVYISAQQAELPVLSLDHAPLPCGTPSTSSGQRLRLAFPNAGALRLLATCPTSEPVPSNTLTTQMALSTLGTSQIPSNPPPIIPTPTQHEQQQQQQQSEPYTLNSYFVPIGHVPIDQLIRSPPLTGPASHHSLALSSAFPAPVSSAVATLHAELPPGFTPLGRHKVCLHPTTPAVSADAHGNVQQHAPLVDWVAQSRRDPRRNTSHQWSLADVLGSAPALGQAEQYTLTRSDQPSRLSGTDSVQTLGPAMFTGQEKSGGISEGSTWSAGISLASTLADALGVRASPPPAERQ